MFGHFAQELDKYGADEAGRRARARLAAWVKAGCPPKLVDNDMINYFAHAAESDQRGHPDHDDYHGAQPSEETDR